MLRHADLPRGHDKAVIQVGQLPCAHHHCEAQHAAQLDDAHRPHDRGQHPATPGHDQDRNQVRYHDKQVRQEERRQVSPGDMPEVRHQAVVQPVARHEPKHQVQSPEEKHGPSDNWHPAPEGRVPCNLVGDYHRVVQQQAHAHEVEGRAPVGVRVQEEDPGPVGDRAGDARGDVHEEGVLPQEDGRPRNVVAIPRLDQGLVLQRLRVGKPARAAGPGVQAAQGLHGDLGHGHRWPVGVPAEHAGGVADEAQGLLLYRRLVAHRRAGSSRRGLAAVTRRGGHGPVDLPHERLQPLLALG
mmetsp:Transcript_103299/g.333195  ORF Transcript_103299/g.333195 Transcript_103299/m.333195 type:complete len:298 (+) Transcript_103299:1878-2771(+)